LAGSIKGITIEIGANTTGLGKALEDVNKKSRGLQTELKQVESLLKMSPGNTELIAQKQELLAKAVANAKEKLDTLRAAQSQVEQQFAAGKISDEQYRAFVREVAKTESALYQLEGGLDDVGGAAKRSGDDAEKSGGKWKSLGGTVAQAGEGIAKAGVQIAKVAAAAVAAVSGLALALGKKAVEAAIEFEDSLAKVATIADTAAVPLNELSEAVLKASNKTGIAATEINEALYQAISAGADTADALGLVETAMKAAKGGFTDSATAIDGLTSVLNAYNLETSDADRIANQFLVTQNKGKTTFGELAQSIGSVAPTASAAGVATNDLMASLAALTANGIDTSAAVTGMKTALSNIIKPSKEASDLAAELGINFNSAYLNSVGWTQFLQEIKDKTGGSVEVMGRLFGSVEGLNTVLTLTSDSGMALMNETLAEMESNTDAVDDAFGIMANTTGEHLNRALNAVKNVGIEIGGTLAPAVEKAAGYIQELTAAFSDADGDMGQFADTAGGIVVRILNDIVAALPKVVEVATGVITSLVQGLTANMGAISDAAGQIIGALIEMIYTALPDIAEAAIKLLEAAVSAITDNGEMIAKTAVSVIATLVEGITKALPTLVQAGIQILLALIQGIAQVIPQIIPAIVSAVTQILQTVIQSLPLIIQAGLQLLMAVVNGIVEALPLLIQAVIDMIPVVVTAITDSLPLIIEAGIQMLLSLILGIVDALPLLIDCIIDMIPKIVKAIADNLPKIIQAGVKILLAVVEGIINAIPQLIRAIIDMIPQIVQSIIDNLPQIIRAGIEIVWALIQGLVQAAWELVKAAGGLAWDFLTGIWDGIKAGADWLWQKISGFFTSIVDGVKNLLGIHSPSVVFAGIGRNMGLGLADGITGSVSLVDRAMDRLNAAVGGVQADIAISGQYGAATRPAGNTVTLNVYANTLDEGQISMLVNVINRRLGVAY
jgi:TP901 family phage tail tape measure protein